MEKSHAVPTAPAKLSNQYNVLVKSGNGMTSMHFVYSDIDLLEVYKSNLLMGGQKVLSWDKGVIDMSQVVGVFRV